MNPGDGLYFQIRFAEDRMVFRHPEDQEYFKRFCQRYAGERGYIFVNTGDMEKSVRQLRFFHGPLIDAFVRLTGVADRQRWKMYLKQEFLTRDRPEEVPSLRNISLRRMAEFIQRCIDHLIDENGHLEEYEAREYQELSKEDSGEDTQGVGDN